MSHTAYCETPPFSGPPLESMFPVLLPLGICELPLGPGPVPMLPVLSPLGPGAGVTGVTSDAGTVVVPEDGVMGVGARHRCYRRCRRIGCR